MTLCVKEGLRVHYYYLIFIFLYY